MENKIVITGSSHKAMEKLEMLYTDFKEIKKITTYLNQVNFLFDDYPINDTSVDMILENFDGTIIYVSGLNCGYWGEGPRTTQNLLMKIGFTEEESHKLVLNEALKIEFKERGNFKNLKISTNYIFEIRNTNTLEQEMKRAKGIKDETINTNILRYHLSENTKIDIVNKKIYIQNPQKNSILGLIYLINLIDVYELEYYIGNKSTLENSLRANELFRDWIAEFDYQARGVNLIIRSDKFDIVCFININSQVEVISTVYYEIFKESIFKCFYSEKNFLLIDKNISKIKSVVLLLKSLFSTSSPNIKGKRVLKSLNEVL